MSSKICIPSLQYSTAIQKCLYLLFYLVQPCQQFLPTDYEQNVCHLRQLKSTTCSKLFLYLQTIVGSQDKRVWITESPCGGWPPMHLEYLQQTLAPESQTSTSKIEILRFICQSIQHTLTLCSHRKDYHFCFLRVL